MRTRASDEPPFQGGPGTRRGSHAVRTIDLLVHVARRLELAHHLSQLEFAEGPENRLAIEMLPAGPALVPVIGFGRRREEERARREIELRAGGLEFAGPLLSVLLYLGAHYPSRYLLHGIMQSVGHLSATHE